MDGNNKKEETMKAKALWICPRIGKWKTRAVVKASRHESIFSPEFLGQPMFPDPKLSREERFE